MCLIHYNRLIKRRNELQLINTYYWSEIEDKETIMFKDINLMDNIIEKAIDDWKEI